VCRKKRRGNPAVDGTRVRMQAWVAKEKKKRYKTVIKNERNDEEGNKYKVSKGKLNIKGEGMKKNKWERIKKKDTKKFIKDQS